MQLVGQKQIMDIIDKWEELPNFLIIQGPRHYGKTYLLIYLCKKFGLHYVKMKNNVSDVRELISLMKKDSNTLYHFKDFDSASLQAKNALLKITEEPKQGNYIAITGNTQIKTLESRAKKLIMAPYVEQDMVLYMNKYFDDLNDEQKRKLYLSGIDTPAKIEYYSKCEQLYEIQSFADNIFNKLTYINALDCMDIYNKFDSKYDTIDNAILFLNMLIKIIENNILDKQFYHYYEILNIIIDGKEKLERDKTLNRKFMIYRIFFQINLMRGNV